jgi:hypothetical protein
MMFRTGYVAGAVDMAVTAAAWIDGGYGDNLSQAATCIVHKTDDKSLGTVADWALGVWSDRVRADGGDRHQAAVELLLHCSGDSQ